MFRVVDGNAKEKEWMDEAVVSLCIPREKNVLFINAEHMNADEVKRIRKGECSAVVYAGVPWSNLKDEKKVLVFYLRSQENVGMLPGYPFSCRELFSVYQALMERKMVDNSAVVIVIRKSIVKTLLESLKMLKSEKEQRSAVQTAEQMLDIHVTEQEIREQLIEAKNVVTESWVPSLVSQRVVRGVFCNVDRVLFTILREIDKNVVAKLREGEKKGSPVALWTDYNVERVRLECIQKGVKDFPVIHSRNYAGRKVECVIDALTQTMFRERYRIYPEKYVHFK